MAQYLSRAGLLTDYLLPEAVMVDSLRGYKDDFLLQSYKPTGLRSIREEAGNKKYGLLHAA